MGSPRDLVDHFFRHESGRLVAGLTRRFGTANLELIEDAVQSALMSALTSWTQRGIPEQPSAWLTRAASNRVIDHLRRRDTADRAADRLNEPGTEALEDVALREEVADDQLRMLLVCCDPGLPRKTQLVLALKLLCGFSTREIAARLFLSDANVQKMLSRGRARLRESWPGTAIPGATSGGFSAEQWSAVHRVIYLLFNEGYSSQRAQEVIRRELCEEALRLGEILVSHSMGNVPESWALLALMHLHIARLSSRIDAAGRLVLLADQDRGQWDREHIRRGLACLCRSAAGETFSRYHGEAAILVEHCLAPSWEATRWSEIVALYEILERFEPSPLYTLNRAIALAEWQGPKAGLRVLRDTPWPEALASYYLWDATLGELLRRSSAFQEARPHLERAVMLAPTEAEKAIFRDRLGWCDQEDPRHS